MAGNILDRGGRERCDAEQAVPVFGGAGQLNLKLRRLGEVCNTTVGVLTIEGCDVRLYTVELPWKDNLPGLSCVPKGTYQLAPRGWEPGNPKGYDKTRVWELVNVPGRSNILIHVANWARELKGCIAPGHVLNLDQEAMVQKSKEAVDFLREVLKDEAHTLTIA